MEGAVRVSISYGSYRPGCIQVSATDFQGRTEVTDIPQHAFKDPDAQQLNVAVFRKAEWTRKLSIEVISYDNSSDERCSGTVIERHSSPVTVPLTGVEIFDVSLLARDDDHDTFIGEADKVEGTDCDDRDASVHPRQPERCTEDRDVDCDGKAGCADTECLGKSCNDHNRCTSNDQCDADASCKGMPAVRCDEPPSACHESPGVCDAATGTCFYEYKDSAAACNDFNVCTLNDRCNGPGICAGDMLAPCVASDACHRSERSCPSSATCVETVDASKVNTACTATTRRGVCRIDGVCSSFPYIPSNFDPDSIPDEIRNQDVHIDCGSPEAPFIFDSGTLNWVAAPNCPLPPLPVARIVGDYALVPIRNLNIGAGRALRLQGPRPVILAVYDSATLSGDLLADADLNVPGAGGNRTDCITHGSDGGFSSGEGSGGGGAGFGSAGAAGGRTSLSNPGGAGGTAMRSRLEPVIGGCPGGTGGSSSNGGAGGAGGGALHVAVAGTLQVDHWVSVSGGGGLGGRSSNQSKGGGGGGGSGGGLLLEAFRLELTAQARLTANGGGGAQGGGVLRKSGANGADGSRSSLDPAPGGHGESTGSSGGQGGAEGGVPGVGGDGVNIAGGGGGGGVGVIRLRGFGSCGIDSSCNMADDQGCDISPKVLPECP